MRVRIFCTLCVNVCGCLLVCVCVCRLSHSPVLGVRARLNVWLRSMHKTRRVNSHTAGFENSQTENDKNAPTNLQIQKGPTLTIIYFVKIGSVCV